MKIRIASRSGEGAGELTVPDTLPEFLTWLSTQGEAVTVTEPGKPVVDPSWGAEPHPDLWTVYLIDEYD